MSTPETRHRGIRPGELLALLSLTMAMTALSIDMMLPAFGEMRTAFEMAPDSPRVSATVTALFIGLASAQILYGPLSDRFGRKPVLYAGIGLYTLGAIGSRQPVVPIIGVLEDQLWTVRREAVRALGAIGDLGAVDSLKGRLHDKHWEVRKMAAE